MMLCLHTRPINHIQTMAESGFAERVHKLSQRNNQILPPGFSPTDRDVVCGRARENFHHGGNRYFRDLINRSIGPYLAARTKLEKSDAIAVIVDQVRTASPSGGFVKKDAASGRWYRIKEAEARDKVGHAIRKAVQRLEDTKPKLAERLRKENVASLPSKASSADSVESKNNTKESTEEEPSVSKKTIAVEPNDRSAARAAPRFLQDSQSSGRSPILPHTALAENGTGGLPPLLSPHDALSATQLLHDPLGRSHFLTGGLGLGGFLAQNQGLPSSLPYERALGRLDFTGAAKAREDVFLSAIKQREEKRLQEMEYASRLMLSARHHEDINRSLLAGSAGLQPSLLSNAASRYSWLPATLPPSANRLSSDHTANDSARLFGLYGDKSKPEASQKRGFR